MKIVIDVLEKDSIAVPWW